MGSIGSFFGLGGSPKVPSVTMPPPAAHPPTLGSTQSALTAEQSKQKAAAAEGAGFDNTIGTSPQGLKTTPKTTKATLLGQ